MNKSKVARLRVRRVWQKTDRYTPGIAFQQLPDGTRFDFFGKGMTEMVK